MPVSVAARHRHRRWASSIGSCWVAGRENTCWRKGAILLMLGIR